MAGYNRVILVGNLTRDPEHKRLDSGQSVCRLGLAVNRQYKNRQTGNVVQEVCFIDVDVWGPQAETCRQYLQKGRPVLVEGRLKLDTWDDAAGQTRSKHSIIADNVVFLGTAQGTVDTDLSQDGLYDGRKSETQSALEKNLLQQIDQIKGRTVKPADSTKRIKPAAAEMSSLATTSAKESFVGGEMNFKDEPPFEDDLPF